LDDRLSGIERALKLELKLDGRTTPKYLKEVRGVGK